MPTVLSLFSGSGGMDLGFEGDFDVLKQSVNLDFHPDWIIQQSADGFVRLAPTCFRTIFANDIIDEARTQWVSYFEKRGHDPNCYKTESIVDLVKRHRISSDVFPYADVVTGGFPCTDFSLSGKRRGVNSNKNHFGEIMDAETPTIENRGMLYFWMREVISMVRPKVFVAENVEGLASMESVVETIKGDFESVGYEVLSSVLYAPNYGVPQTRSRIFFVGLRNDLNLKFEFPVVTHADKKKLNEPDLFPPRRMPYVTCNEAFDGLKEPEDTEDASQKSLSHARFYGKAKSGKNMQGQIEVSLDKPGPTIRAEHHGNIEFRRISAEHGGTHFEELAAGHKERRLTVRECARLQTFPDDFEFMLPGISTTKGYRGVGNAVPPLLAYNMAQSVKKAIEGEQHGK